MNAAADSMQHADTEEARRFIEILTGDPAAAVTWQTFDESEAKRATLSRMLHGTLDQHAEELARLNQAGAGIFVMVNAGDGQGRKRENVTAVRAVFSDEDTSRADGPRKNWPLQPQLVVESSPGRYHYYWLADPADPVRLEEFTNVQKAIAQKYNTDPQVCDLPRVMRVPGFLHQKGVPFMTRVADGSKLLARYRRDELLHTFSSAQEKPQRNDKAQHTAVEIAPGNRNNTFTSMAGNMRRNGATAAQIEHALAAFNDTLPEPLPLAEVRQIANSVRRYEPGSNGENCTDAGNARRLVQLHGPNIRYVPSFKKWLVWNGSRWLFDEDGEIVRRAKATASSIYQEAASEQDSARRATLGKWAHSSESAGRINAMIELAKSEPGIPVVPSQLDADPMLLGMANGVLDLRTGALREARREDFTTKCTHVPYDHSAACPKFDAFLSRIMNDDPELLHYLQKAAGYSLTGHTTEQCLLLAHGIGANGKSVLQRTLMSLLGDYATQVAAETLMVKRGDGPSNDIARLRGARFVAASEVEDGQRLAESMVKQMTGEDVLVARFLYAEHFEFKPGFKIWLAANHKPIIRGDDYAIWRRIHLIPFAVTIPEQERDRALPDKLQDELPGILNWALEGCRLWQAEGLNPPEKVRAAVDEYRSEMDVLRQWMDECCSTAPNARATAKLLYASYKEWAADNTGWTLSQTKFGRKLSERGYQKERTRGGMVYHGIGLLAGDF